jgi:sugar lactone lactonase YvrE
MKIALFKIFTILGLILPLTGILYYFQTLIDREASLLAQNNDRLKPNNKLKQLLADNATLEKLADGFQFTEGAVWHPDGFLLFSDIPANTIYQWQEGRSAKVFRKPSNNTNGNAIDAKGRLISAQHGDRTVSRREKDGKIVILADKYGGKRLNSPNDLAIKSDGSIYFTDPPYGIQPKQEELGFYGVYRLAPNGKLTLLAKDMVRPNGIAFSPDESKLYVSDSQEQYIRVFDVKPDGTVSNGRTFATLKDPSKEGTPDGLKVDRKGNVYSPGAGGVWVFSPTGDLLGKISVPEVVTNLAWGQSDFKTLYITASNSLYRIRLKIAGR